MSLEWKKCFLNVPLNSQGIEEHNSFNEEWNNIFTVELSEKEYYILSVVFDEWNEKFDIIIDIFEEETLEIANEEEALEILNKHISNNSNKEFVSVANKLKVALQKAISVQMPLYFDF